MLLIGTHNSEWCIQIRDLPSSAINMLKVFCMDAKLCYSKPSLDHQVHVQYIFMIKNIFLILQMVSTADRIIMNVVAKWPGAVHDARIYRESDLARQMDTGKMYSITKINYKLHSGRW